MNRGIHNRAASLIAATLFMSNSPIYAAGRNVTYDVECGDANSLEPVLKSEYGDLLKGVTIKKSDNSNINFGNETLDITVEGLDLNKLGIQNVTLRMKDADMKKDSVKEIVVNVQDLEAPKIDAKDMYSVELGSKFDLQSLIQVTDNSDTAPKVTVEGKVDTKTLGTYTLTVNAQDALGNISSKDITVEVTRPKGELIVEAALSQLGVDQDCTMLVTNSLKAAGIDFHGAPEEYLEIGEVTDTPVPGDIVVYSGHVAIYIGDNQAVHGGWMSCTTAISSVECTNPFIAYVHVA
ncbi:MAG: DUF5011 domain-containing protein [Faecalicoccus sp.]|nr:DUF5011 domain-containing protein [Faecalicoccus sp.]